MQDIMKFGIKLLNIDTSWNETLLPLFSHFYIGISSESKFTVITSYNPRLTSFPVTYASNEFFFLQFQDLYPLKWLGDIAIPIEFKGLSHVS